MTGEDPLSSLKRTRPVDRDFADRLEARLRIQHAATRPSKPTRSPWRPIFVVGPAVLLVAIASAVLVLRDGAPSAALELHEAHNVTVTLTDGTSLVDPDGLDLVDGVVVSVGPGGRAVIGDVELGPGAVVTVRDGELVTADPATTTSTRAAEGPDPDPASGPPGTAAPDRAGDDVLDADRAPVDDTSSGTGPRVDPPGTTLPGDGSPSDRPDPQPTVTTAVDADPVDEQVDQVETRERVVDLALVVRVQDRGVLVGWRATGVGVEDLRVVLLRGTGPDVVDPDWPPSGGVSVVADTRGSDPGELVDALPAPDATVRYRAVALAGDEVVARSAVQSLLLDR